MDLLSFPFSSRAVVTTEGLDSSFGAGGAATYDLAANDDWINAIALDSVSRTVAVGTMLNTLNYDMLVARFNTDGSLDTTFANEMLALMPSFRPGMMTSGGASSQLSLGSRALIACGQA